MRPRVRRRYRVVMIAAVAAAAIVPAGFAADLVAINVLPAGESLLGRTSESTMLFAFGVLLVGLAAAVRRSSAQS